MADFIINAPPQTTPVQSSGQPLVIDSTAQTQKLIQQLTQILSQPNLSGNLLNQQSPTSFKIQLPQLANLIINDQPVILKTATPINNPGNFTLSVENSTIVQSQGQQTVRIEGQILQSQPAVQTTQTSQTPEQVSQPVAQKFTIEIPVNQLAQQNLSQTASSLQPTTSQIAQNPFITVDEIVNNTIPQPVLPAVTDNLSENIRPLLPQNLNSINLTTPNDLAVKIISVTTPNAQTINAEAVPTTTATSPQQVITGTIESFPSANEALIRTDFGTLRIPNVNNIPTGSTISFQIQSPVQTASATNSIIDLNPTNIQTLKLALEAQNSPLANLLKIISTQPGAQSLIASLIPNPQDKNAYMQSLFFLSAASKGGEYPWINDDVQGTVNKISSADNNPVKLKEMFGMLQNFANKGPVVQNSEWNSYIIPFYDGSKLSYVTMQIQRDLPDSSGRRDPNQKRKFILELEQNDVGRLAIEGLYSNPAGRINNMDMIIKTENNISEEAKAELQFIYSETAIAYGFTGQLTFAPFTSATIPAYTDISKILGDGIVI